jgi:hypothetical protein
MNSQSASFVVAELAGQTWIVVILWKVGTHPIKACKSVAAREARKIAISHGRPISGANL